MTNINLSKIRKLLIETQKLNYETKSYLFKSIWVMSCCEFESQFRSVIQNYIEKVQIDLDTAHINILLRGHYGDEQNFNFKDIVNIKTRMKKDKNLTFKLNNFLNGFQSLNFGSVEKILISLGFNTNKETEIILKKLDAIYTTRTAIVHTNTEDIQKTYQEMEELLSTLEKVYSNLANILK